MKVYVKCPSKVTLFGEHAIVYGYPAISASLGKYLHMTIEEWHEGVIIMAEGVKVDGAAVHIREGWNIKSLGYADYPKHALRYIITALKLIEAEYTKLKPAKIMVKSTLPVGAGLGTSASVSVATIAGYLKYLGYEPTRKEIVKLAHKTEYTVQGKASPMDTSTVTYGGILYIKPKGGYGEAYIEKLPKIKPKVVIGYVEKKYNTGFLVARVRELLDKNPKIIGAIMENIGRIVEKAKQLIKEERWEDLGKLMDVNHGLLYALGVSTLELERMVYASRLAGAYGAKLTGAGGGGSIVALVPEEKAENVKRAIEIAGGKAFIAEIGVRGVEVEKVKS